MEDKSIINPDTLTYSKLVAFFKLTKFRLSILVVFSAVVSYITIYPKSFDYQHILSLAIGGFLVTASANSFNQVIEKNLDKLMSRTQARPLPLEILSPIEALLFALLCGGVGSWLIFEFTNELCGILSVLSIALYALVYTPLKRITPFSVFVGAIPGALPTLIGALAGEEGFGSFHMYPLLLFTIQFFWQFPHFWAIAWVADDDYRKAGFRLLPSGGGKDHNTSIQIMTYTLFLLPLGLIPAWIGLTGINSAVIVTLCGVGFLSQTFSLMKTGSNQSALRIMFGSFLYLPIVQIAYLLDKV